MSAAISPLASATPAPMSATNVTATTPKPAKLGTNEVKMKRMPSTESKPVDRDRHLFEVPVALVAALELRRRLDDRLGRVLVVVGDDLDGIRDGDRLGHAHADEGQHRRERRSTPMIRYRNIRTGCGTLFPARSMKSRNPPVPAALAGGSGLAHRVGSPPWLAVPAQPAGGRKSSANVGQQARPEGGSAGRAPAVVGVRRSSDRRCPGGRTGCRR